MWNLSKQTWYDQVELAEARLYVAIQGRVALFSIPPKKGLTTGLLVRALYILVCKMSEG